MAEGPWCGAKGEGVPVLVRRATVVNVAQSSFQNLSGVLYENLLIYHSKEDKT